MAVAGAIIAGAGVAIANDVQASDLNADAVMNKMSTEERNAYLSGVVEGLAYSRYLQDRPDEAGMNCIYDWYYSDGGETRRKIHAWFGKHPNRMSGVLLYVLIKQECGE